VVEGIQISGASPDTRPVLHRGSKGTAVGTLQNLLRKLNFAIAIDEDFGPATELAVSQFQKDRRLTANGIVGPPTWNALEKGAKKTAGGVRK
jgi:putative chitinase